MLLSQVEGFLEIARRGNLSRAAEALFVTQPGLTARIQSLEEELGEPLFRRTGRGMELTEAGRAFRPYAERAVESLRGGATLVSQVHHGVAGELRLGTAPAVSTTVLPELLTRYVERFPSVRLVVRTGHTEEIVEALIRDEIAIGLVRELQDPRLISRALYEDRLVLVARPGHPFAEAGRIDLGRIGEERMVLFDRTGSYYDLTNALFRAAGVSPRGVIELDNIDAAKQIVGKGLGVALLPFTTVASELASGKLIAVEIDDAPSIRRRIVAVRRADAGPPTVAVAGFEEVLGGIGSILPSRTVGRR